MRYELWLSLRYLRAKKKQTAISIVTFLSIVGVAVGVAALIVVLSAINGFNVDLRDKILGLTAHVTVFQREQEMRDHAEVRQRLLEMREVVGATPFIVREVLLQAPAKSVQAVLRGVDPSTVESTVPLGRILITGKVEDLASQPKGEPPGIMLGKGLMRELKVKVGDSIVLVSPEGTLTPWGNLPKWRKVRVKGVFNAGYWEFDSRVAFVSILTAQQIFEIPGRVSGIELRLLDPFKAPEVRRLIQESPLGASYLAQDWTQLNRNLMMALAMQKRVIFVILLCIVGVAALLIISILVMMVMEKQRDIAVLKAMGARSSNVMSIFVSHGLSIGSLGVLLGCAGGLLVSWHLEKIVDLVERVFQVQFLPEDVYYIGRLTSRSDPMDVALIVGSTLLISVVASLYPSWRAARVDPVEILRYE
ncbi:MAG: lipoprotein-releasing ABC transporter permease subunit [Thermodesulfobacteriota bacterium]